MDNAKDHTVEICNRGYDTSGMNAGIYITEA